MFVHRWRARFLPVSIKYVNTRRTDACSRLAKAAGEQQCQLITLPSADEGCAILLLAMACEPKSLQPLAAWLQQ